MSDRFREYLTENIRAAEFVFTPRGIADAVDNAAMRAVYEQFDDTPATPLEHALAAALRPYLEAR